jgi:hypothetical protein
MSGRERVKCLTRTRVQPVAHGGIDAKMGAKNREMKKQRPVVIAARPVRPPSAIPAPDSIKAVTGEVPNKDPIEMEIASVQYAIVERGKEPVFSSTTPENLAME